MNDTPKPRQTRVSLRLILLLAMMAGPFCQTRATAQNAGNSPAGEQKTQPAAPTAIPPAPGFPLPEFFSSDPRHDALLNQLFRLHGRADFTDDSLREKGNPNPAVGTVSLWRDWEVDELLWHDYSPRNYPLDNRPATFAGMLADIPIDKFGYHFTAYDNLPDGPSPASASFKMGWPFPTWEQSLGQSVGYEWNGADTEGWTVVNGESKGVSGGFWNLASAQADPQIVSPAINVHWFWAPFVEIGLAYDAIDGQTPPAERVFKLYWKTADQNFFSEERAVRSDQFPVRPIAALEPGKGYRVFLPMYLHPLWKDHVITGLRLDPLESATPRQVAWRMNFLGLNFDTRHVINNPVFVRAHARKFFWDGDRVYLKNNLPNMRRAMEFMLTHMRGRELHLLDQSWFQFHDGIAWDAIDKGHPAHGIGSNYFDIVSMGPRDIQSCVKFYLAVRAMAEIETYVEAHPDLDSLKPTVIGPDGASVVPYKETAATLTALIEPVRQAVHKEFWNPATGRYAGWRTSEGMLKDYGYAHFNVEALEAGIPDAASAKSILDWLDGRRTVEGDTSTGTDIYHWRFAARMSTRRNILDYIWVWNGWKVPWGDQVQDGGAVLWTTFYDVKGRLNYGDTAGAGHVWRQMLDHHADVQAAGGKGFRFYREYYEKDPTRGLMQGGGPAGGLGLDREFSENMLTPCAWPIAWLGIDAPAPEIFQIAPTLPPGLTKAGVKNVVYRGNRLDITAEPNAIDLHGSDITKPEAGRLRLVFKGQYSPTARVRRNGEPLKETPKVEPNQLVVETTLAAARFTIEDGPH